MKTTSPPPGARRRACMQLLVAAGVLSLGMLVYLVDRPADTTPHLAAVHALTSWPHYSFGRLGDHLPTFAHAFAFSVLTASLLEPAGRGASCLTWLATDVALELGQHPALAASLPSSLQWAPFASELQRYFASGTFDVWDLASVGVGAALAYAVLRHPFREVAHA